MFVGLLRASILLRLTRCRLALSRCPRRAKQAEAAMIRTTIRTNASDTNLSNSNSNVSNSNSNVSNSSSSSSSSSSNDNIDNNNNNAINNKADNTSVPKACGDRSWAGAACQLRANNG